NSCDYAVFLIRSIQKSEYRLKILYFGSIFRHSHLFGPKLLYFRSFFAKAICRETGALKTRRVDGWATI
ncbi:hypothetical protein, partial [Paenibacillus cisolokensis]|uniref:hypothetical protein n=1 Tax=Paenibacillus cisolokensis TaxID=1658519 RepID=UPI001BCC5F1E